jgi:anaerobic magnesium-protoporphyrin IX monomethyl ester cyclase
MRVLLINTASLHVKHKAAIPLGLLSIATYLTARGYEVRIYDRAVQSLNTEKYLSDFMPDIVGLSVPSFKNFSDAIKLSNYFKKINIPVVWGGPISSLLPETVMKSGLVDYVVIGEGEITMHELLMTIENNGPLKEVDGIVFKDDGQIRINKNRAFADLADLPIIDFSYVQPEKYFVESVGSKRMLHIYASKGCVSQCTYCYNPAFSKCVWRSRPHKYFLSEIKYLVDNCEMDSVYFADDLLSPNKEYLEKFCRSISDSGIKFVWGCELRADTCSNESIQLMYDSGCRWIYFGIESGSQKRQKAMKKNLNLDRAKKTLHYCSEIGIATTTSFIINFPDQTADELKETVRYIEELGGDIKIPSFYGPIPQSEIYNDLIRGKRLKEPETCEEWEKMQMMDIFGVNYSKIPDRELKVVSAHYYLQNFFWKDPTRRTGSRVYIKKAFIQVFGFLKKGSLEAIPLVFRASKEFFDVVFYALMFPKIRKAYGLNNMKETGMKREGSSPV